MPLKRRGSVSERLSVWFSRASRSAKASRVASSGSRPPRSNGASAACAAHQMDRGAALRAGLREHERARRELELREGDARRHLRPRAGGDPAESAGDHQMHDEVQVVVEVEHDPLAEPAHVAHGAPDERVERRLDAAQREHAANGVARERLADQPTGNRLHVDRDVGQLGHDW